MNEILDLDVLVPRQSHIKINGKTLECKVVSLEDIIRLEQLSTFVGTPSEKIKEIKSVLSNTVPGIENEDINIAQFKALIDFIKDYSSQDIDDKGETSPVEKKTQS